MICLIKSNQSSTIVRGRICYTKRMKISLPSSSVTNNFSLKVPTHRHHADNSTSTPSTPSTACNNQFFTEVSAVCFYIELRITEIEQIIPNIHSCLHNYNPRKYIWEPYCLLWDEQWGYLSTGMSTSKQVQAKEREPTLEDVTQ